MKLSSTPRTGWIRSGVKDAETISEHIFEVAIYSLILAKITGYGEPGKTVVLALLHDLPEAVVGDIPKPDKDVSDYMIEKKVLRDIIIELGLEDIVGEPEYTLNSKEYRLVKISDNLATLYKGLRYYGEGYNSQYLRQIIVNSWEEAYKLCRELGFQHLVEHLESIRDSYPGIFR